MEMSAKEQAKMVRPDLRSKYKNISVRIGTGTASGWIYIDHEVDRPHNCECVEDKPYCSKCRNAMNGKSQEIENLVINLLDGIGSKLNQFTGDDGYNTTHNCLLTQISIK